MATSKKQDLLSYIGTLIFAVTLWILDQLGKPQIGIFEVELCYPTAYILTPTKARLQVEASGYVLLQLLWRLPSQIPVLTWAHQSPSDWLKAYIETRDFKILAIDPPWEEWLGKLQVHKLPIQLQAKVVTPPEVELLSAPIVSPESVYALAGFSPVWKGTLTVERGEVSHEISLQPDCAYYPNKLRVHLSAERMIKVRLAVQPRIVGPIPNRIQFHPPKVFFEYKLPENSPYFPRAKDFDFYIEATQLQPEDSVVYPILTRVPAGVKDIKWYPPYLRVRRVHYVR